MKMCYIPKRFIFTLLTFVGMLIIYATRVNLSVAIMAMVNSTREIPENGTNLISGCPNLWHNESHVTEKEFKGKKYNWNPETQGLILSSFYYGYIWTQLPGGVLCAKLGAKWLFGGGIVLTSVLYFLIPLATGWGVIYVVTIRILEGIVQGITFPVLAHAVSNWAPKYERSRMNTIIYMGIPFGIVIGSSISGTMCASELIGGWPSTFYFFGTIGCIWFLLWSICMHETPECHPHISKDELLLIQQNKNESPQTNNSIPWKDIFCSFPMWAVIIATFGQNYGAFFFLTMAPTYFKTVLHFDIKKNGLLSALPYVVHAISAVLVSHVADKLRESKKLSITTIRKICNTIGFFSPALCYLGIIAVGCQDQLIVALLCLGMFLNGFTFSGFTVTFIDMSPDYAGLIMGIANTTACIGGIIGPVIAGFMTANGATVENWNKIFGITVSVYFASGLFFAIFASAEVQPWGLANKDTPKDAQKKDKIFCVESKM